MIKVYQECLDGNHMWLVVESSTPEKKHLVKTVIFTVPTWTKDQAIECEGTVSFEGEVLRIEP